MLGYRIDGAPDAPPLVLLNPVGTTTEIWDPCLAALTDRFQVVRVDTRGHGASTRQPPIEGVAVADLAGDLLETLDALEIGQVDVAGHSLGGMTAMWLAVHRPERVRRLALICTAPSLRHPERYLSRAQIARREGMTALVGTVDRWLTPAMRDREPLLDGTLRAMLIGVDAESYAGCCEAVASFDIVTELTSITAATLVVSATEDEALPPEHGRRIAAAVPGARYAEIGPAAHLPTYEQAGPLATLLIDHFAGNLPASLDVGSAAELSPRDRALLSLAAAVSLGAELDVPRLVRAAVQDGLSTAEVSAALLHTAQYAGASRTARVLASARDVLADKPAD